MGQPPGAIISGGKGHLPLRRLLAMEKRLGLKVAKKFASLKNRRKRWAGRRAGSASVGAHQHSAFSRQPFPDEQNDKEA